MERPRFGTLVVIVDKARNLPNRKKIGKQDAYAIVRLGHEVQRTPTDKRAGQVPSWNHEIRFQVPSEAENILKISIFNEDSKIPDLIGDCSIDLSDLYRKHEYDSWFDLKYKDKPAGEVYAELTFYYEGPPKPKPKVELSTWDSYRPLSSAAHGRTLPTIPHGGPHFHGPVRQRTMSPGARPVDREHGSYDPANAMATLNLAGHSTITPNAFVASPYQPGVKYAETWDGRRDNRILQPAPGDVRRKSFSNDVARPASTNPAFHEHAGGSNRDQQSHAVVEQRRNSHANIYQRKSLGPRPYVNHSSVPDLGTSTARYEVREDRGSLRRDSDPALYPPQFSQSARPRASPPYRGEYAVDDTQYVEPLLDPRHGSSSELRNSPRIISPCPEYPVTYPRSPVLDASAAEVNSYVDLPISKESPNDQHRAFDQGPRSRSRQEISTRFLETGSQRPYDRHQDLSPGQAPASQHPGSGRALRHSPQQQYQYHDEPHHLRTTSLVTEHAPAHLSPRHGASDYNHHGHGDFTQAGSGHAQDWSHQRRSTYAYTPAQYAAQTRPLPVTPNAAPARPAKIPLGLSQEEYDILYGR